jgi:hypothetical protein
MRILICRESGDGEPPIDDAQCAELRLTKLEFLRPDRELPFCTFCHIIVQLAYEN